MSDNTKAKPLFWLAILLILILLLAMPFTCHVPARAGAFDPLATDPEEVEKCLISLARS